MGWFTVSNAVNVTRNTLARQLECWAPGSENTLLENTVTMPSRKTLHPPVITTRCMTRSWWRRINGSWERSKMPYTFTRDPLPSTETEAMRSSQSYSNSSHVTLSSCDQPFYDQKRSSDMDETSGYVSTLFLRDIFILTLEYLCLDLFMKF